jgi:dTDP-4-dehydrorhamnose reductase
LKAVIIGRAGQVARALAHEARAAPLALQVLGRPEFDLEHPAALQEAIKRAEPDIVINAAAYTAVERAETEPERAFQVNAVAAEAIARVASELGAAHVLYSTDYVFSGDKLGAYVEGDETAPRSVYGASKREGESRALSVNARTLVLRTSWVYDASGGNFVRTMLRLAKAKPKVDVVADQVGCPTFASDLAQATLRAAGEARSVDKWGIYNCAGAGEASWATFAQAVFAGARARGGPFAEVNPIAARDFPSRVARPANSRLDCSKLAADYGIRMRPWEEALNTCLDELAADGWRVE